MINLILIYPPNRGYAGYGQDRAWFPLGIAYLASFTEKNFTNDKIKITCLDLFDKTIQESIDMIDKYYIDNKCINIVACTVLTEQRFGAWKVLKNINKFFIKVIGGVHSTLLWNQIISNYDFVDFIVKGEGEVGLLYILNKITTEKHYGLIIDGTEKIIECDLIKNLDDIPFPINALKFFKTPWNYGDQIPIISSRGCTDCCSFCSTTRFWKGYRSRSALNIFSELKEWIKLGYYKFKFQDDACTANLDMWKELCNYIIGYSIKIEFEITARIDQFDKELIDLLKKAGCNRIAVGIESGSKILRDITNKKLDENRIIENSKLIKSAGITLYLMFISGLLGETDETVNETIYFITKIQPDFITCQPLMIFPGTYLYTQFKEMKMIDDNYWLEDQPQPYYMPNKSFEWQQRILNMQIK